MPSTKPTSLILRRTFPRPVTFADLRRAADIAEVIPVPSVRSMEAIGQPCPGCREAWTHSLKEATGALDEVHAVVDGRTLHVTTVPGPGYEMRERKVKGVTGAMVWDLLQKAEDAGYWERPHEVRLDLFPSA